MKYTNKKRRYQVPVSVYSYFIFHGNENYESSTDNDSDKTSTLYQFLLPCQSYRVDSKCCRMDLDYYLYL